MKKVLTSFAIFLLLTPLAAGVSFRESADDKATRAKLEKRVSINFTKAPLPDVVEFLRQVLDVNIVLDEEALWGRDPRDVLVTLRLRRVRARTILKFLMRKIDMKYAVIDGVIFISDEISEPTYLRIYDVRDLVAPIPDFAGAGGGRGQGTTEQGLGAGAGGGAGGVGGGGGGRRSFGGGGTTLSVQDAGEALVNLIITMLQLEQSSR